MDTRKFLLTQLDEETVDRVMDAATNLQMSLVLVKWVNSTLDSTMYAYYPVKVKTSED